MKGVKFLISIISLMILVSCNSLDYGAGAVSNWITGLAPWAVRKPLEKMFADGTDDIYEDLVKSKQKQQAKAQLRKVLNQCSSASSPSPHLVKQLKELKAAQEQRKCLGCVPWGKVYSCEKMESLKDLSLQVTYSKIFGENAKYISQNHPNLKNVCCEESCKNKCESLCPDSPEILQKAKSKQNTHVDNLLPVTNTGEFYTYPEEHQTSYGPIGFGGVCNAHSTVRRKIATLTMFSDKFKKPSGMTISQENVYYEKILKDLLSGKVREVPGYSNVFSFLSRPHLQPILRKGILKEFHHQAFTNPLHIENWSSQIAHSKSSLKSAMTEIQKNIEISGVSQITYGNDDNGGHTVEVFHTYEDTVNDPRDQSKTVKAKVLCTIDSNDTVCTLKYWRKHAPCVPSIAGDNHATEQDSELRRMRSRPFSLNFGAQRLFQSTPGRPNSDYTPGDIYCPNKMIVLKDGSYSYQGYHYTHSRFSVDSTQSKSTKQLISSLRKYCVGKTKCNLREIKERKEVGTARSVDSVIRSTTLPTGAF